MDQVFGLEFFQRLARTLLAGFDVRLEAQRFRAEPLFHDLFEANKRKVGARGLMMILEEILLESMYVLPSDKKVKDLLITKDMIEKKTPVFEVVSRIDEAA
jgi:ATP-dependent protease Clp ATPase subunit